MTQKTAVITGAAGGIGLSVSLKLATKGYAVVLVDFDEKKGNEALDKVKQSGGEGIFVKANVTLESDMQNVIDTTINQFGRIDVFHNNAGILEKPAPLAEQTLETFDRVISINVRGVFLGMKLVIPIMLEQKSGCIINSASNAGLYSEYGNSIYSASKHAVIGLTKTAANEYGRYGIRINAIAPGAVSTTMTANHAKEMDIDYSNYDRFASLGPLGRPAEADEIANVVSFLTSDEASYMNGSIVQINGGLRV
ncbi:SDR family NAD(P)-dependent oxidoreductase [Peribacillus sp. NPDC097295]|uniref:SDR family NAD(P)-dependent oxidoreductase n=1 Tax=Peribacillus sp. NPDC097295 TaxID=3364402 RepID=UPI00380071CD